MAADAGARGPLLPPSKALPSAPPRRRRRERRPAAPAAPGREGLHTKRSGTPTSARGGDGPLRPGRRRSAAPSQPAPLGGRVRARRPAPDSPTAPCPSSWRNLKRLGRLAAPLSVRRLCRQSARPPTGWPAGSRFSCSASEGAATAGLPSERESRLEKPPPTPRPRLPEPAGRGPEPRGGGTGRGEGAGRGAPWDRGGPALSRPQAAGSGRRRVSHLPGVPSRRHLGSRTFSPPLPFGSLSPRWKGRETKGAHRLYLPRASLEETTPVILPSCFFSTWEKP